MGTGANDPLCKGTKLSRLRFGICHSKAVCSKRKTTQRRSIVTDGSSSTSASESHALTAYRVADDDDMISAFGPILQPK